MIKNNINKLNRINSFVKSAYNFTLDTFFPRFCVGCGIEGTWLCDKCRSDILFVREQFCPGCQRLSENGAYCHRCRFEEIIETDKKGNLKKLKRVKPLSGIIVASYFEEGPTREMIHNFKYNGVTELADELGEVLYKAYRRELKLDIITFTPLHPRRLAQRGYNQAQILAQKLSELSNIKCIGLLQKTKQTKRQVELTGKKRRKNLKGLFKVLSTKYEDIKKKRILIIDDIATTGTTLNECARVLKDAGAKEVWGLVVARG